jgi:CBS-domain-containing membrane protein
MMNMLLGSEKSLQGIRCAVLVAIIMLATFFSGNQAIIGPLSASATLIALLPNAPASQPRTVLLSHVVCAVLALLMLAMHLPMIAAVGLTIWLAIVLTANLKIIHAPAVAHAAIIVLGKQALNVYLVAASIAVLGFAVASYSFNRFNKV